MDGIVHKIFLPTFVGGLALAGLFLGGVLCYLLFKDVGLWILLAFPILLVAWAIGHIFLSEGAPCAHCNILKQYLLYGIISGAIFRA